jgi:CRP/FNR family transcriptional regulator
MKKPSDKELKTISCERCALVALCSPISMGETKIDMVGSVMHYRQYVKRGDFLYRKGDKFSSIIAIVQGSAKLSVNYHQDYEQILGFCLIGETVGLSGMRDKVHLTDAQVLEETRVCEIPFEILEQFASSVPQIQREITKLLSDELVHIQQQNISLGKKLAEERLASFLLDISKRYRERGYSPENYVLGMSRNDIANFLGLTKETVSRLLNRFQKEGILLIRGKHVQIACASKLNTIAGNSDFKED